jgi:hypothetical protein
MFPLLGRCLEEPQHDCGHELGIIRDRDVAEPGEPLQLGVAHEGEEARALHADQRVGGSLPSACVSWPEQPPRRGAVGVNDSAVDRAAWF